MNSAPIWPALLAIFGPVAAVALCIALQIGIYKKTTYYRVTGNAYFAMRRDKGLLGEYETYKALRAYERKGAAFLFNLYLPKGEDGTTEIDVLMIARNGIFVFESKNYSGWIFGDESRRTWTQTLPRGRGRRAQKERFLNPVWQNALHISALKSVLGERTADVFSLIVFSNRCTLKNVKLRSGEISVVHRRDVAAAVRRCAGGSTLSDAEISELRQLLYPYSQVTPEQKRRHVEEIRRALADGQPPAEPAPETPPEPEAVTESAVAPAAEPSPAELPEEQPLLCPRCGAELFLRTATKGAHAGSRFYGCSRYPACRYVRPAAQG